MTLEARLARAERRLAQRQNAPQLVSEDPHTLLQFYLDAYDAIESARGEGDDPAWEAGIDKHLAAIAAARAQVEAEARAFHGWPPGGDDSGTRATA